MGITYLAYLNGAAVASGSTIPMNAIVRRRCSDIGTDMTLKGNGYYKVTATATLVSTAGGDATITLLQNGTAVTGATATETISANGTTSITFQAVVRNGCCNNSTLSLLYSGPVLTSTSATVVIENA